MTILQEKLRRRRRPLDGDLESFIQTLHDQSPGITVDKITKYPTSAGCMSYELLAREIDTLPRPPQVVVDLACGNGPLTKICLEKVTAGGRVIGVDASRGELEEARKAIPSRQVTFLCERAQCLSIPSHSVDVIVCHLALMLMKPIEPVIQEAARILKPGGLFAGTLFIPPQEGTMCYQFYELRGRFLKKNFSDLLGEGFGDARAKTKDGFLSLFSHRDWVCQGTKMEDYDFLMDDTAKNIWGNLKVFYSSCLLSDEEQRRLGEEACELFNPHVGPRGTIPFRLPFRLFSVKRT